MDCPRCSVALTRRREHDIDVDVCPGCQGMFVHRGELNRVAEPTAGDIEFATLDAESFRHDDAWPVANCPACPGKPMDKVEFIIHTGIVLDHCPSCGGFWLDGTELDRINAEVRRLNEQADASDEPPMLWFARFIWSLPR